MDITDNNLLINACKTKNIANCQYILKNHKLIDLDYIDENNNSALHIAINNNLKKIAHKIVCLLNNDAKTFNTISNEYNECVLILALKNNMWCKTIYEIIYKCNMKFNFKIRINYINLLENKITYKFLTFIIKYHNPINIDYIVNNLIEKKHSMTFNIIEKIKFYNIKFNVSVENLIENVVPVCDITFTDDILHHVKMSNNIKKSIEVYKAFVKHNIYNDLLNYLLFYNDNNIYNFKIFNFNYNIFKYVDIELFNHEIFNINLILCIYHHHNSLGVILNDKYFINNYLNEIPKKYKNEFIYFFNNMNLII
jgi:hypothetical protein